ncbi:MAG: primosomal protein N' [Bacteroidia bacterium]|nr:primosomal protein N' [Bacteroidia bacterium]MDW8134147.1 primosomal protein N' [Bacteroidia bacterium]
MWGEVWVRRRGSNALTYALPPAGGPYMPGMRLLVPLGAHNTPTVGLLMRIIEEPPSLGSVKEILQRLDESPLHDELGLRFFQWIANYYLATPGDIAYAALPGRIGAISDWRIFWQREVPSLKPKQLWASLRGKSSFSLRQLASQLNKSPTQLLSIFRRWAKIGAVRLEAVVKQQVRHPPSFVEVVPELRRPEAFQCAWESLPQEVQPLFMEILRRSLQGILPSYAHLLRKEGKKLKILLQHKFVRRVPAQTYYQLLYAKPLQAYSLTSAQQRALEACQQALQENPTRPILLHGITASGKTFLYMELMRTQLQMGKQVLYLLPEIALTKQTLDRLRATFGEAMELYHSGLTEGERFRIWQAVRKQAVDVIVGTRSALFLPFSRLGLIVVDEEHDASYGQEKRPPLYQARDAAVYYAHLLQIPIILGSATPSLESYKNAQQGKYAYVKLMERAIPASSPQLHIVDMRVELQEKLSTGVFSSTLRELLLETLDKGQQAILFRNRRGYAPVLLCQICGYRWECPHCAITLTYHKRAQSLLCHYCAYKEKVPARCPVCGGEKISFIGIGTERIEEQLRQFFPQARVLRLDRDSIEGHKHEALIAAFERHEADILVGTQMVTKGLDFERVTLVGVLYADSLLGRVDFRAEERAYQLLVQLMGRAGRRGTPSHVVIQAFKPETQIFQVLEQEYEAFAHNMLKKREKYNYPPFSRIIEVNLYHPLITQLEKQAQQWAAKLKQMKWGEVLGPVYGDIPKVQNRYHMQLLLKLPSRHPYQAIRDGLLQLRKELERAWGSQSSRIIFRVDP